MGGLNITGGTFSSKVDEQYLAEGYVQNANGEVGSREEMMVAEVTTAEGRNSIPPWQRLWKRLRTSLSLSCSKIQRATEL